MKEYEKTTEILTEKSIEGQSRREKAEAAVLSLILLWGILLGFGELRYSFLCVEAAMGVGALVIFLRALTLGKERAERALRVALYIVCICCLLAFFNPIRQAFLFTVDGILYLWNLRFQTDLGRLAGLWLTLAGYREQKGLEDWKASAARGVETLRYGEDSLPEGRVTEASGLLDGDRERLQVTMAEPEELYLRGFVGSVYAGNSWEELPGQAYSGDYEGMLKWLEKKGFSPTAQYAAYALLDAGTLNQTLDYTEVQVKNENASRKYLYLPAGVSSWQGYGSREQKDWQVESRGIFGTFRYQFSMVKNMPGADGAIPGSWIAYGTGEAEARYLDAESVYRSFVEASYLDMDEETESLIRETFFPEEEDLNFDEVTSRIRQVLRIVAQYQKKPQDIGENGDLVRWFLSEYKRGNAVSYASAAVLAYRAAGYPARYVEGYHLTAEQAAQALEQGDSVISLTTENAHAWAEVYVTGMGWLPVEVVPGMYVETYTSEWVEGKPTYQVKPSEDQQDLLVEEEGEGGEEDSEEPEHSFSFRNTVRKAAAGLLLLLYLCLILYLILELQRALRLAWKERREKERYPDGKPVDDYVERTEKLLRFAGIQADFRQPEAVRKEAEEKKLGLEGCNFNRVLDLVRKARFGGKEMTPHERLALDGYSEMVEEILKKHTKLPGRLVLRYVYLVK